MKRFWDKVNRTSDPSQCWEWNAYASKGGYGQFKLSKKSYRSHRLAYELCFGPIPPKMCVCHKCDNVKCCNPSHLFLGTQLDNVKDMMKKGRAAVGEGNGKSKLTNIQVNQIKDLLKSGLTYREIGANFGVTRQNIGSIARGETRIHN
mgnify:CR=1 FL=1